MEVDQAIQQYGGVGLLLWAAAQVLVLFIAWSRAGIRARSHAEDIVGAERQAITLLLRNRDEDARKEAKRRDEDTRAQAEKTDKLEGEIYLLKSTMAIEREESSAQIDNLSDRLDKAQAERDQLEAQLKASEKRYQTQLEAAYSEIAVLREQIKHLETEIRAMEGERQKLVDELYREMRTTARLTSELARLQGQHEIIDRVIARIQPGTVIDPTVAYNPSPV
jgi:chromosome segregation ATPase